MGKGKTKRLAAKKGGHPHLVREVITSDNGQNLTVCKKVSTGGTILSVRPDRFANRNPNKQS